MPTLDNGTKSIKFLLSKASNDILKLTFPMLFPTFRHISAFQKISTSTSFGRNYVA